MVRIPSDRTPTHPGVMLREEFLDSPGNYPTGAWLMLFLFHINE